MNERTAGNDPVLVAAGSKHGSTADIAERIGSVLEARGMTVTVEDPAGIETVSGYEAVILGSAVYAGHWVESARLLADRIAEADPRPQTWIFSSGPIGDPPKPEEEPVDVAEIMAKTSARGHRVFAGKLDKSKLSFGEKAIVMAFRAPEGDFRDWTEIENWATQIADELVRAVAK